MSDLDVELTPEEIAAAEAELTPAERRQLETRARKAERGLAVHEAGLGHLTDEQRSALFAVAGGDLSKDNLTAKATSLFGAPESAEGAETETPGTGTPDPNLAAEARMANLTAGGAPPPPASAPIQNVMERAMRVSNPDLMAPGQPLYEEALAAIRSTPGLVFGDGQTDGTWSPV